LALYADFNIHGFEYSRCGMEAAEPKSWRHFDGKVRLLAAKRV
jgi:hypothetical protein